MSRVSAVLFLTGLMFVGIFASLPAGGAPAPAVTTPSCPAPTPAPGEPTPTPPPTPHPTEFDVGIPFTFVNELGQSASDLHICFGQGLGGAGLDTNAPDCPLPTVTHVLRSNEVDVVWPSACVDPGESVRVMVWAPGSASVQCSFWTLSGSPLNTCPGVGGSPTDGPAPTPTPTPTPTQTPTLTPTPTPTPNTECDVLQPLTPAPGCPETPTPSPPIDVTVWTFPNDSGQAASDLHGSFTWPFSARLVENAPGCPEPELIRQGSDNSFDLDWGIPCVDSGESVKVEITSEPPALPRCFYWTLFGQPIVSSNGGCLWSGDVNCSGKIDSADALRVLAIVAGFAVTQEACASPDVDCDDDEDAVDALKILRYVAELSYTQHEPCPDIGMPAEGPQ